MVNNVSCKVVLGYAPARLMIDLCWMCEPSIYIHCTESRLCSVHCSFLMGTRGKRIWMCGVHVEKSWQLPICSYTCCVCSFCRVWQQRCGLKPTCKALTTPRTKATKHYHKHWVSVKQPFSHATMQHGLAYLLESLNRCIYIYVELCRHMNTSDVKHHGNHIRFTVW